MSTDLRGALRSEILLAGFDHWSALSPESTIPKRETLDPSLLPPSLLPHIVMLEVQAEPLDFRYRVIGEHVMRRLSLNHTGRWMSEIAHQTASSNLFEALSKVVKTREPCLSDVPFADPDKEHLASSEVVLPLCDDTGDITRLLIFVEGVPEDAIEGELVI